MTGHRCQMSVSSAARTAHQPGSSNCASISSRRTEVQQQSIYDEVPPLPIEVLPDDVSWAVCMARAKAWQLPCKVMLGVPARTVLALIIYRRIPYYRTSINTYIIYRRKGTATIPRTVLVLLQYCTYGTRTNTSTSTPCSINNSSSLGRLSPRLTRINLQKHATRQTRKSRFHILSDA